jgi:hypothetical protein
MGTISSLVLGSVLQSAMVAQPACSVRTDSLHVRLGNGQPVYVQPQALTFGNGRLLILGGGPVFLVDPPRRAQIAGGKAVGLLMDTTGKATLVPAPAGVEHMRQPRALFQQGVGWHVVWVPEFTDAYNRPDSATMMHSVFDGARWSKPSIIARFASYMVIAEGLSGVVGMGEGLAIAMPEGIPGRRRATVLVREAGQWQRYSVPDVRYINYAALARAGEWLVLAYTGRDEDGIPAILAARSRDNGRNWAPPAVISKGTSHQEPTLVAANDRLVLAWTVSPEGWATEKLQWAHSEDAGGRWSAPMDATPEAPKVDYAAAVSSDGRPLIVAWLKDRFPVATTTRQRIGVVLKDSIAWTSDEVLLSPVNPILGGAVAGETMFVTWISNQGTRAEPKSQFYARSLRIRCDTLPTGEKR